MDNINRPTDAATGDVGIMPPSLEPRLVRDEDVSAHQDSDMMPAFVQIAGSHLKTLATVPGDEDLSIIDFQTLVRDAAESSTREQSWVDLVDRITRAATFHRECRDYLYRLTGTEAQTFIDALQEWLDITKTDHAARRSVLCIIVKISSRTDLLPQALTIEVSDFDPSFVFSTNNARIHMAFVDGQPVAVKRSRARADEREDLGIPQALCREILVWRQLKHPRIVKVYGMEPAPNYGLITEWHADGTLNSHSRQYCSAGRRFTTVERDRQLRDIAEGLSYLHQNKIVHGDLKPSNIVVRLVNQKPRAALLDFGTAVVGDKTALRFTTYQYFAGTRDWAPPEETTIAPPQMGIGDMIDVLTLAHDVDPLTEGAMYELIHGAPAERRPRSTAARDVWAFGQLCLFMCTGSEDYAVSHAPSRPPPEDCRFSDMTSDVWELINSCIHQNPAERPKMTYVLSNYFNLGEDFRD